MRRKLTTLILMFSTVCCLLSGCGKTDNSGPKAEPQKSSVTEVASESYSEKESNAEKETAAEKEAISEKETSTENEMTDSNSALSDEGAPVLLLNRASRIERNEDQTPYIYHYYSFLTLEKEYAASHSLLAENLSKARSEIEAHEYDTYMLSVEDAKELKDYTFECSWNTYLRRCDDRYLSFVNECRNSGTFDFDAISYLAHSYYVDSGKEIELTDIIADEDAFYDLLAAKVKEKVDEDLNDYMGESSKLDINEFKARIKKSLDLEDGVWTLDPQGITFWFDSNTFSLFSTSCTVFFFEDKDRKIFKEEFSKDIPDEWIMQMPDSDITYFDEDDSGEVKEVMAYEILDYNEEYDRLILSGFGIRYGDDFKRYDQEEASTYDFFLMHKDHKNLILESHYEYDDAYISTYPLDDGKIKEGDTILAGLEYSWDEAEKEQDIAPYYIPTNMDNIRVLIDERNEAHYMTPDRLSVSTDGKLTLASGRHGTEDAGVDLKVSENTEDPLKGLVIIRTAGK